MQKEQHNLSDRELEFAVFCIENVAASLAIDARLIFKKVTEDSDILYEYIVPNYEVLHTQSKSYITADIIRVMSEKGLI